MMRSLPLQAFCLAVVLLAASADGQTSYPMLMDLHPVAVQVGTTAELTVSSRYGMEGAYQVLITGEGVQGEVVDPGPDPKTKKPRTGVTSLKIKFTADKNAPLGVRDFRLATPRGVSTLGQLVVVQDPVTVEKGKNSRPEQALEVALPATVCGGIERNEDVDYYKFKVEAGTSLTFHVRSARLQDRIHDLQQHADPVITLKNAAGVDLALVDNYFFADPLLHYHFEQAGEYYLEIRDVRYEGNRYWRYCVEIHDRPFATTVFPLQAIPGQENKYQPVGFQVDGGSEVQATIPADWKSGPQELILKIGEHAVGPVAVHASTLPQVLEADGENNAAEQAQSIPVPAAVNGRIETETDIDCYRFDAKKGERFCIEVIARRYQSSLDSNLRILNDKGRRLTENDDLKLGPHVYADSRVENWTAPADGAYVIEIRDLQLRGGPEFVYLLELTRAEPTFVLQTDVDKSLVTSGTNAALFVRAFRKNGFNGPIQLAVEGLPENVTAHCGRILPDGDDGVILFSASGDTQPLAKNIRILGRATVKEGEQQREITAVAEPLQEIYMPGGGRGHYPVSVHTLAVCEPLDLTKVSISPQEITLKPGESQKIEVTVERSENYKKNVSLEVVMNHLRRVYGSSLPQGVTLDAKASKKLLTGKQSKGHLVLKADAKAKPVERQLIPVMAHVSINFVMKMSYAAEPLWVTVAADDKQAAK